MSVYERKLFGKQDPFLIAGLLVAAAVLYGVYALTNRDGGAVCRIFCDGGLAETVKLTENRVFSIERKPNISFEIKDGAIAFIESDCPDKVCVHSGFLSRQGQMAACLPNGVSIQIAADDSDVDMIAN